MYYLLLYIWHIDVYCVKGLWCCFPITSLFFIYSMMGLLIYKYEPLWQEVSVKFLIFKWPLKPVGLFLIFLVLKICKWIWILKTCFITHLNCWWEKKITSIFHTLRANSHTFKPNSLCQRWLKLSSTQQWVV